ncbi:sulfite exporter TauE/SafE family protein [Sphingomonas baiyangensis]|uniref:Probable membrane transporter protein n=1 Tax=Sphingomonas baiyangensis TaxID=2572576 RepID=A0A4U1L909_9SPHN|nr:sulfite exporter TauE/SafE family protein [Sphingomonas baiyangensis]TKD52885.1 sulfite exporter TauE/SafE family protein [Sphingomonas baiyangensis]
MIADPVFYAVAVPAVILLGLAKGGFSGVGALSLPALAFIISPVQAAAILLPILIVQDVVSVWAFRRTWNGRVLAWTLPGAGLGIALGWYFAASVQPRGVLAAVGAISLAFGLYRLAILRRGVPVAAHAPGWMGAVAGVASGFTSHIAHAGQPPFQLWVLPQGLPRDVLVGTTAIFFAIVNWAKLPAYWALGQFTRENLATAAALMPVAIASTVAGVWLVRRVAPERFYAAIYVLMVLVGAKLLWDGLA